MEVIDQEGNVLSNDDHMIKKNTRIIIVRKPLPPGQKFKVWEEDLLEDKSSLDFLKPTKVKTEEDLINDVITKSGEMYGKHKWLSNQGKPYPGYICNQCNQPGHWRAKCPYAKAGFNGMDIKKATGIPRSFLKVADKETICFHLG
ncbi:MAG: hypothetical protein V2J13_11010 [Cycloclasticus sp.]|jgi:hypothetical protein|nr:hypothetical protein [Cycloclasticus sp.]